MLCIPKSKATIDFYVHSMKALQRSSLPFLIGGTYGQHHYTGINRVTKDLDLFVRPVDVHDALKILSKEGYETEILNRTWLAKAYGPKGAFIDIIFRAGNGLAEVDHHWFKNAPTTKVFGMFAAVVPPEEMIWSKAFTMERERFDMADILHLILDQGVKMNWHHLVDRFAQHWPVLMSYLILFRYSYPSRTECIPTWVINRFLTCLQQNELEAAPHNLAEVCQGTLLSGTQFLQDIEEDGFKDARFSGAVKLSRQQLQNWREDLDRERLIRECKTSA